VTFRYKLSAPPNLEPDEYGQVLFSVDGDIRSLGPNDYLVQQNGAEGGEGGPDRTTGWRLVTLDLGNLNAGNHTLTFGGFANRKTAADEYNDIVIDDVSVESTPPTAMETVFSESFARDPGAFTYADDTFKGTNQPAYASGTWTPHGYFGEAPHDDGWLRVTVGNINNNAISNMSGGWKRSVFVSAPVKSGILSFKWRHVMQPNYEPDEFSQMIFSVNGYPVELSAGKLTGDGEGGPVKDGGWQVSSIPLPALGKGTHTFVFGAYNNHKSNVSEYAEVHFDDISFRRSSERAARAQHRRGW
jgi:hypothetical protein